MRITTFIPYCIMTATAFLIIAGCSGDDGDTPAADALPQSLEMTYTRADAGEPVSAEEVRAFTKKAMGFLKKIKYFEYVLDTTYGVDASTGMKDWQFWYNERFRREGDKVTFYHPENLNDGGHNLHIPLSRVLGDLIAASLLTGDDTASLAAAQLCKGMSASMLGMVFGEDDTLHHLMTRNVAAFNHEFVTYRGKRKAVDFSGWFSSYDRWNCFRYPIENNPWWGKVWVTNLRSKDDVPHIFRLIPIVRYAAKQGKGEMQTACAEALELLEGFGKDIVDSDYRIRTKDENGDIQIPGFTDDEELNAQQGDLASFINYRDFMPEGECNARRGAELIGYHHAINEDCGRGEPNGYDAASFNINRYNKRICRYFHVAHIANAMVNRDWSAAEQLMSGLEERMDTDKNMPESKIQYSHDDWWRNLAVYFTQSATFGYPMTSEEVRLVHHYYLKAIEKYNDWPYWDLWADSVADGTDGSYRPPNCEGEGDEQQCWWQVENLAQMFENCWSPFTNPTSKPWVDCDIVRDPSQWDEADAR